VGEQHNGRIPEKIIGRQQKACPVKFPTGTSEANFTGMKKKFFGGI
jgi:hypothetical protein